MTDDQSKHQSQNNSASLRPATKLVHRGRMSEDFHGFINPPVVRASTVLYPDARTLITDQGQRYTYGLNETPLIENLADLISELEGAAGTVLLPSGLAACTLPLLALLKPGDQLLVPDNSYGPTRRFCEDVLKRMQIETTYYDPLHAGDLSALIKPSFRAIMAEAPGSGTFEMPDLEAIIRQAKDANAYSLIDNTWATPLIYAPLQHGFDISIQAGTKYYAGHSDVLIGSVSANEKTWPIIRRTHKNMGVQAGTEEIYLTLRGMRSLTLRLEHHERAALSLAHWLKNHPKVAKVLHPAFEDHPGHAFWQRDFKGRSSGLFAFVLKGDMDDVATFLDSLQLFGMGYSWGGFESLAIWVNLKSLRTATQWQSGPIIRLSIGLEDVDDLRADLEQALAAMKA
jgi:cystathionine beta-lyase